jgi:hypothetical protein
MPAFGLLILGGTVIDGTGEATYLDPARHPIGIERVIVNGRPAIVDRAETGERPGRLLRGT